MRQLCGSITVLALLPFAGAAGEPQPVQEYAAFSRLVHQIVVKLLPKQFEVNSGWGQMIEVPANLKLAGLRKMVKVGDHLEAPHGAWRRFKGKIEDPHKNLKIVVKEFKKLDDKTYRLSVDVEATLMVHAEWQQWQKGLFLIGGEAIADADFKAALVCDVAVSPNFKTFPPELNIQPRVTELELDLVDFRIRDGLVLKGERAKAFSSDLKDLMRSLLKASEPILKDSANQAIVESLKEGRGTISAGAILKALPKAK